MAFSKIWPWMIIQQRMTCRLSFNYHSQRFIYGKYFMAQLLYHSKWMIRITAAARHAHYRNKQPKRQCYWCCIVQHSFMCSIACAQSKVCASIPILQPVYKWSQAILTIPWKQEQWTEVMFIHAHAPSILALDQTSAGFQWRHKHFYCPDWVVLFSQFNGCLRNCFCYSAEDTDIRIDADA